MANLRHWSMGLSILILLGLAGAVQAEKKSLKAMMPWQGDGSVYQIAADTMLFLGAFEGIIYAETSEGKLDEGFVRCPASQKVNLETGRVEGEGYCMITPSAGDVVYATWSCHGEVGICQGDFKLTGGTGQYEGVTGSSKLMVRTSINTLIVGMSSGSVIREATGIAILPKLTYTIPEKK